MKNLTINKLMLYCKYSLVHKYKVSFTSEYPVKEEILKAIFTYTSLERVNFKGFSPRGILETYYVLEAKPYSKLKNPLKREVLHLLRSNLVKEDLLSEASSVMRASTKTPIFSKYIVPPNTNIEDLPF